MVGNLEEAFEKFMNTPFNANNPSAFTKEIINMDVSQNTKNILFGFNDMLLQVYQAKASALNQFSMEYQKENPNADDEKINKNVQLYEQQYNANMYDIFELVFEDMANMPIPESLLTEEERKRRLGDTGGEGGEGAGFNLGQLGRQTKNIVDYGLETLSKYGTRAGKNPLINLYSPT